MEPHGGHEEGRMNETDDPLAPISPPLITPSGPNSLFTIFSGPNGLRAGWRLLIFFVICAIVLFVVGSVIRLLVGRGAPPNPFDPNILLRNEAMLFSVILMASWIMSKIEGRAFAAYGLPWRTAFQGEFWQGIVLGFVSISLLVGVLHFLGVLRLGDAALQGSDVWRYALLWSAVFLFVGFFEEFGFRGYILFTLTTGRGFWIAAVVSSVIFGGVHIGNSGETWLGALSAGSIGLLFCLMLRRTGSLWLPVGFHASWDWGETYFYGVPDSGQVAPGHLFAASLSGSRWLSGGSVGPEASVFCLLLIAVLFVLVAKVWPLAKYPVAEVLRRPTESRNDLRLEA